MNKLYIVLFAVCLCLLYVACNATVNPYGIAGVGYLTRLGMPAGCLDYNWNGLEVNLPVEMVRPNHYYNYLGISPYWFDYNELTGVINDPAQFSAWVIAHPGKIWIIANEPDLNSQDGLTVSQYVDMYYTYYTLIKGLDPTAKFAIGAMTGGSTAGQLTNTKNWYSSVLSTYKSKYGVTMPIDIWNVHSYLGPTQIEDPVKIINEYITPFVTWCHTVESSAYAGCEVWITELPIGEWMGAVSPDNVIWFMQHYLPRLEQAGITRWFWYVSVDWDGNQGSCCLADRNGQPTSVGRAYSALANSYPNAILPVTPFVPDPTPAYASYDFTAPFGTPWFNKGGYWGIDNGTLRHNGIYTWWGTDCFLLYTYQDFGLSFKMKINAVPDNTYWGGVLLRAANRMHSNSDSGYLLFVRKNGEMGLNNKTDGTVVSVPGAVSSPENYHDYRVVAVGSNIKAYVDGNLVINWTDPNSRYTSGYNGVIVGRADASYDDFNIIRYPSQCPQVTDDGTATDDLSHLHATWSITDIGASIQGYRYAVGTTPGATDTLDWTYTTGTSASANVSLIYGKAYYISVKAVYTNGLESSVGTSDGIAAVSRFVSSVRELKECPDSLCVQLANKIVSAVFPDCIYVQEPNRAAGIRVNGKYGLECGDIATIAGRITQNNGEAVLADASVLSHTSGTAPRPIAMNAKASGGGALGLQSAVINQAASNNDAFGLSNVGLLVRLTGKVTAVDVLNSFFYLDDGSDISDGSGYNGVRVSMINSLIPQVGTNAKVTGVCSATLINGKIARFIRPRSAEDAQFDQLAVNLLSNSSFETGTLSMWHTVSYSGVVITGTDPYGIFACGGNCFFESAISGILKPGTLYQVVTVTPGTYYAFVTSRVLHNGNTSTAVKNRIGIDPLGGLNINAANVAWSDWDMQEGSNVSEWRLIQTPTVTVTGTKVTVFLRYYQEQPAGLHVNCFDNAYLLKLN